MLDRTFAVQHRMYEVLPQQKRCDMMATSQTGELSLTSAWDQFSAAVCEQDE